jgi:hypothetical protein
MATKAALDKKLDEIYGGDPADFTNGRDELAKELKGDGEAEQAAAVKKLKRPTQAAATVNRLSLDHSKEIAAVLKAGAELRKVQANLGAKNAGEKLKAAAAEQREAIDALVTLAAEEYGASSAVLDRVAETLHGTASDEAVAEAVEAGRLEREGQAAGLGGALVPPPKGSGSRAKKKAEKEQKPKADAAAKRKRRTAEDRLAKAEAKLEAAATAEGDARERLDDAKDALRTATSVHGGAEKALERARDAVDRARDELEKLPG